MPVLPYLLASISLTTAPHPPYPPTSTHLHTYTTTHQALGAAVEGGLAREELWITSKIKGLPTTEADLTERVKGMVAQLQCQYLDLLLIHWPGPSDVDLGAETADVTAKCKSGSGGDGDGDNWFDANIDAAWDLMLKLRKSGLCKRIGVSNFYQGHVERLIANTTGDPRAAADGPFANQIYIDISHPETAFVAWMQERGVAVMAYRPVTFVQALSQVVEMGIPHWTTLTAVAASNDCVSPQQLVLAYLRGRGIHVVAKSSKRANVEANLEAASKAITEEDRATLAGIGEGVGDEMGMVAMMGLADEYAKAFEAAAPGFVAADAE